jgi:methylated-DNA-[protein]-cysteine S-methyltransferase
MKSDCAVVKTPVGRIKLSEQVDKEGRRVLAGVGLYSREELSAPRSPLLKEVAAQLERYFAGELQRFELPLTAREDATPFQRRVWARMQAIPYGEVLTYGELAAELGTAARAVGGACGKNPLPIVVPCHRVVAANGLGGFSGEWESGEPGEVKKLLLQLEGVL